LFIPLYPFLTASRKREIADKKTVSLLDGISSAPGGINGNGKQVGKQFAEITAISAYSFIVSCLLLPILKYIPGMHLRVTEEAEMMGLDVDQFFDEQIGDWDISEEIEKRKGILDGQSTPSMGRHRARWHSRSGRTSSSLFSVV
jgi:Ammonium Transporter Family